MAYISVRNWRIFQHYDPEKRVPPWIKTYTRLINETPYRKLSPARRALLHGLWLLYGMTCTCPRDRHDLSCTCLELDVKLLNTSLGLAAKMADYKALERAGFLHIVASKRLARRYLNADLEVEVEIETPKPPFSMEPKSGELVPFMAPEIRVELERLAGRA